MLIGEIGGAAEETAAGLREARLRKPVASFIAGRTAPRGSRWATPARSSAAARHGRGKVAALEAAGIAWPIRRPDPALLQERGVSG